MDPSMSPSNVQVSNHIPDDIVFSILSKLSFKSLKRFECVCKPWSLLFDNPCFMTMYRNYFVSKEHPFYDGMSLLLHVTGQGILYSLSGERFENIVKLDWPNLPERDRVNDNCFNIMGPISFNGTLFLEYDNNSENQMLMFWNPTTTEFKIIYYDSNCSEVWSDNYQVGYDHVKDVYKMIRRTHCLPRSNLGISSFWEIFTLNNNSWRKVDDDFPHSEFVCREVYLDGASHWLDKTWLVSFDFIKESFITTHIPLAGDISFCNYVERILLAVLNGSIGYIEIFEETSTFHISILGELGVKESWTKLFIIGPVPCLQFPSGIFGIGKNGNILIRKEDNELAWFDISTGTIDDIGVTAQSRYMILFHKESPLPIGGIYSNVSSCFQLQEI